MYSKKLLTFKIMFVGALLFACTSATPTTIPQEGGSGIPDMTNPASTNCIEQGYRWELRDTPQGEVGICIFPDGSECEEWAFFRGECGPLEELEEREISVRTPSDAFAAALEYIRATYLSEPVPPNNDWSEQESGEGGLLGASTFQYSAEAWSGSVSFPIVAPENTIFTVVVDSEVGFQWEGTVNAFGEIKETSIELPGSVMEDLENQGTVVG